MALLTLNVQANVVDIRTDKPKATDQLLIDSNAWYWATYNRSRLLSKPPKSYQTTWYPNYVSEALKQKAVLCYSGISFSEIGHLIEKSEWEIFSQTTPCNHKEFRHNYPKRRAIVVAEINAVWQILQQHRSLDLPVDKNLVTTTLQRLQTEQTDMNDAFIVAAMMQHGITSLLTDDADLITVQGITVFTANTTALHAAQQQGRLIVR